MVKKDVAPRHNTAAPQKNVPSVRAGLVRAQSSAKHATREGKSSQLVGTH